MSTASADALQVIAAEGPRFSLDDVVALAAKHYGLEVNARELVSERDQNFHLATADGREFVLKIASSAEDPRVTDFQVQALRHIEAGQPGVAAPRIVPARDGRLLFELHAAGTAHLVRLVTYLPGVLMAGQPLTPALCRSFGRFAARLGQALSGFQHPGSNQSLIWNMNDAAQVKAIAPHIPDARLRRRILNTLEHFEAAVRPAFDTLRTQVVHNDMNPENVLLDPHEKSRVVGVIDFGDMTCSPLVVDVAVAASYMREFDGDPLAKIAAFVSAYHAVTPLEREEIDLVRDLILVRLATTVSVLHWRIAERGADDPYLNNSVSAESTAARFFQVLEPIGRAYVCQALRQACASTDVALRRD